MCYAVKPNGEIDLGTLIVPTLRTFDDVQKQDVVDKRRWKIFSGTSMLAASQAGTAVKRAAAAIRPRQAFLILFITVPPVS